jgi:hypothetical protein
LSRVEDENSRLAADAFEKSKKSSLLSAENFSLHDRVKHLTAETKKLRNFEDVAAANRAAADKDAKTIMELNEKISSLTTTYNACQLKVMMRRKG